MKPPTPDFRSRRDRNETAYTSTPDFRSRQDRNETVYFEVRSRRKSSRY